MDWNRLQAMSKVFSHALLVYFSVDNPHYSRSVWYRKISWFFWKKRFIAQWKITAVKCEQIVKLLLLADWKVPCTGEVYWKMFQIDQYVEATDLPTARKNQIRQFIMHKWTMCTRIDRFCADLEYSQLCNIETKKSSQKEYMSWYHIMCQYIERRLWSIACDCRAAARRVSCRTTAIILVEWCRLQLIRKWQYTGGECHSKLTFRRC